MLNSVAAAVKAKVIFPVHFIDILLFVFRYRNSMGLRCGGANHGD
jgi:hypothetical protein